MKDEEERDEGDYFVETTGMKRKMWNHAFYIYKITSFNTQTQHKAIRQDSYLQKRL